MRRGFVPLALLNKTLILPVWRAKKDHDYLCIGVTNNVGKKTHSVLRIRLDRRPNMKILSPARKVIPVKEQVTTIKHLNSTDGLITMLLIAAGRYLEIMHARLDSNSKYEPIHFLV